MARLLTAASGQYLQHNVTAKRDPPLTLACWFYTNDISNNQILVALYDKDVWIADYNLMALQAAGGVTGDPIRCQANGLLTSIASASTTVGYTAGTWHHAAGVFTSISSRTAYLNGGNSATNTSTRLIYGLDRISIGRRNYAVLSGSSQQQFFDGAIADVGIWNVALNATEIYQLAQGICPLLVRPRNLINYYPLIGKFDPEIDLKRGMNLSLSSSPPTAYDHPRIFFPAPKTYVFFRRNSNRVVLNGSSIPSAESFGSISIFKSTSSHNVSLNFGFRPATTVITGAGNTFGLNDLTDVYERMFVAEAAFYPTHLGYCQSSITSTQVPYLISLQKMNASGYRDGHYLCSGIFTPTAGSRVFKWVNIASTGYKIERGEEYAIVVHPTEEPPNTMVISPGASYGSNEENWAFPIDRRNGSFLDQFWNQGAAKDSGNMITGSAVSSYLRDTITTSGHKQAMKFYIPSSIMNKYVVNGVRCLVNRFGSTTGRVRFGLWEGNNLLAYKDVDTLMLNGTTNTNASTPMFVEMLFDNSPVLNSDTFYYIGVERIDTTIGLYGNEYAYPDDMPTLSGICFSQNNGSVWTDQPANLPILQIVFGDIAGDNT